MNRYNRAVATAILFGVGLGGFLDGILLHQIVHWHQMLSAVLPPDTLEAMKRNMVADGFFHLATWIVTAVAMIMLWSVARAGGRLPSTRAFCGYLLVGWGAFNLVEGTINHHVLGLHHVRDLPVHVPAFDWAFLLIGGVGFILCGILLRDGVRRDAPAERRSGIERRSMIPG
jgi:uncharacterized membrane protein